MNIHTIVIHYSATYPDAPVTRDTVDKWHRDRGFREIGYNWFIRRDGTLEEGRPEGTLGAHVRGHNDRTIGICFAGGLERETGPDVGVWNPTPEQEATMVQLIHDIQRRWPMAKKVVGHRNLVATQCPGRDGVPAWWSAKQTGTATPSKPRQKPTQSTTVQASAAQVVTAAGGGAGAIAALDGTAQIVALALFGVMALLAAWIMRERLRKWAQGDR